MTNDAHSDALLDEFYRREEGRDDVAEAEQRENARRGYVPPPPSEDELRRRKERQPNVHERVLATAHRRLSDPDSPPWLRKQSCEWFGWYSRGVPDILRQTAESDPEAEVREAAVLAIQQIEQSQEQWDGSRGRVWLPDDDHAPDREELQHTSHTPGVTPPRNGMGVTEEGE